MSSFARFKFVTYWQNMLIMCTETYFQKQPIIQLICLFRCTSVIKVMKKPTVLLLWSFLTLQWEQMNCSVNPPRIWLLQRLITVWEINTAAKLHQVSIYVTIYLTRSKIMHFPPVVFGFILLNSLNIVRDNTKVSSMRMKLCKDQALVKSTLNKFT